MNHPEVVVAVKNVELGNRIRHVLSNNCYDVLDLCVSGNEVIRRIRMFKPEVAIINYELPDITGLEVSKIIIEDRLCTAILLTNETQKEYVEHTINDVDLVCLNKPFNKTLLLHTMELVIRSKREIRKLETELIDLRKNLESKKLIDQAKFVLMQKKGLSEPEAYRKIQKQSMDSGVPMKDIAKIIIDTIQ